MQTYVLKKEKGINYMGYKRRIMELLEEIQEQEEADIIFLRQVYTMIKRHIERKRKSQ